MLILTISIQDQAAQQVIDALKNFEENTVVILDKQNIASFEEYQARYPGVSEETYLQAIAMDQSSFAKTVLNHPEEERWNDL